MLEHQSARQPSAATPVDLEARYLERVRDALTHVSPQVRTEVLELVRARIDLDQELASSTTDEHEATVAVLRRLGEPEVLAAEMLREAEIDIPEPSENARLTACRTCRREVSTEARLCPHCGAPYPTRQNWRGFGYEYKSKQRIFGMPLVHVAFGRDKNGKMRVARGFIAIGQFGVGAITIAQFGIGFIFGLGQFVLAPIAIGQFAGGLFAVGQFGLGVIGGLGQIATGIWAKGMVALKLFGGG